jgi:uncharacterized protein (TIGR02646 family)
MIWIDRNRRDDHGILIRPGDTWFRTATDWTVIALDEKQTHEARGSVYHSDEVHAALEKLCEGKCAYCESSAIAQSPWDVDHYRPKGRVSERPDHPGYYWLAYEWNNLLLSCVHCNTRKRDKPTWDDPQAGASAGKFDSFPLASEENRAMGPNDDLELEQRLLLDPTRDDPELHITFDITGTAVALQDSQQGAASIGAYHLNRKRLQTERRVRIELALAQVRRLAGKGLSALAALEFVYETLGASRQSYAATVRAIWRDRAAFNL